MTGHWQRTLCRQDRHALFVSPSNQQHTAKHRDREIQRHTNSDWEGQSDTVSTLTLLSNTSCQTMYPAPTFRVSPSLATMSTSLHCTRSTMSPVNVYCSNTVHYVTYAAFFQTMAIRKFAVADMTFQGHSRSLETMWINRENTCTYYSSITVVQSNHGSILHQSKITKSDPSPLRVMWFSSQKTRMIMLSGSKKF